jgi:hypothetical protein
MLLIFSYIFGDLFCCDVAAAAVANPVAAADSKSSWIVVIRFQVKLTG